MFKWKTGLELAYTLLYDYLWFGWQICKELQKQMESYITIIIHVCFLNFKTIPLMAHWLYLCIEFGLIVPHFNLAGTTAF